jgi:hypothetical protein
MVLASTRKVVAKGLVWLLHRPRPSKLEQAIRVPVGAAHGSPAVIPAKAGMTACSGLS